MSAARRSLRHVVFDVPNVLLQPAAAVRLAERLAQAAGDPAAAAAARLVITPRLPLPPKNDAEYVQVIQTPGVAAGLVMPDLHALLHVDRVHGAVLLDVVGPGDAAQALAAAVAAELRAIVAEATDAFPLNRSRAALLRRPRFQTSAAAVRARLGDLYQHVQLTYDGFQPGVVPVHVDVADSNTNDTSNASWGAHDAGVLGNNLDSADSSYAEYVRALPALSPEDLQQLALARPDPSAFLHAALHGMLPWVAHSVSSARDFPAGGLVGGVTRVFRFPGTDDTAVLLLAPQLHVMARLAPAHNHRLQVSMLGRPQLVRAAATILFGRLAGVPNLARSLAGFRRETATSSPKPAAVAWHRRMHLPDLF